MNNRFRFKVFYKPHNKIYNVICLNSDRQKEIIIEYKGSTALVEWKNCDILQCTGLKDKNGTLIYEGDIVQILDDEIPYVIEYEQDRAMFIIHSKIDRVCCNFDNYNGSELEVIGNIYEKPELLEG